MSDNQGTERPSRERRFLALVLAGFVGGHAQDCRILAESTATVGAPLAFVLACDSPPSKVAWEFGDGEVLATAEAHAVSHAYAAPGMYNVFARFEGEELPSSILITALNPVSSVPPTRSGTLLLDAARQRLWNVNVDNRSVTVIDARAFTRIKEIPVGRAPRTLAQDKQGRIWVANQDDATLSLLDGGTLENLGTIAMPRASRPYGICLDPAGGNVYVTLEALGAILRLDPSSGAIKDSLPLFPTPRGIAVAPDSKTLWVTRFISPGDRGEVAQVSVTPFEVERIIPLEHDGHQDTESNGRGVPNALSSLTISPDGVRAWVPFKKDNVRRGMRLSGGGGPDPSGPSLPTFESTVRTGVGQIDLATGAEVDGARLDLDNRSMACAVAFAQRGAFAFVATETSNEIAVINAVENSRATAIEPREEGRELGPIGMQVSADDSLLYIHDDLSREIAVYGISDVGGSNLIPRLALIPTVKTDLLTPEVLRGKRIFYNAADPRMARHKYLSCAVCHLDGGSDGRVWDFTHKGEGLRRTISLLGKAGLGDGPLHWSANFDEVQDFEHDMRNAFAGTGFMEDAVFDEGTRNSPLGDKKAGYNRDLDDLAAYVTSLSRARPSPYRKADGSLTEEAKEGEKIFNRAETGCAVCHVPPRYTDSRLKPPDGGQEAVGAQGGRRTREGFLLHDVGTAKQASGQRLGDSLPGFDTPTLKGLWENAAYLHDGSALTLMEVISGANPGDIHGKTSNLSTLERRQLVAFLMQLDDAAEPAGIRGPAARDASAARSALTAERTANGFRFRIAGASIGGPTALDIRDISGRLIRTLVAVEPGEGNGGIRIAFWDGRDGRGASLPRGMYMVRKILAGEASSLVLAWIP